jgi:hypothetical protein
VKIGVNNEETKIAKNGLEPIFSGFLRVLHFFVVWTSGADRMRKRRLVAIWAGVAGRKQFSHKPVL